MPKCTDCDRDGTHYMRGPYEFTDVLLCDRHYDTYVLGLLDPDNYQAAWGKCSKCHEDCQVLYPCCGAPVAYRGRLYTEGEFSEY